MTLAPVIQTARLTLRPYGREDFAPFRDLWLSEDSKFMGGPLPSADTAWWLFCADIATWSLQGFGFWAIEERATGSLVGVTGLGQPPSFPERELGWHLYAPFRGQGFATEAAAAARDHAFTALGFETLVSYIAPGNAASIAVAERMGAKRDMVATGPDPEDLVYRHPAPEALQ